MVLTMNWDSFIINVQAIAGIIAISYVLYDFYHLDDEDVKKK